MYAECVRAGTQPDGGADGDCCREAGAAGQEQGDADSSQQVRDHTTQY